MSESYLKKIVAYKWDEVAALKAASSLSDQLARASDASPPRAFRSALAAAEADGPFGLIAEIKRASPSKGLIRKDFSPEKLAKAYELGGAACLSVLTDSPSFQGDAAFLAAARDAVALPVLRKDFMLDPVQIAESRALGADCVLLILAILTDDQAEALGGLAKELGMGVLVETHSADEMARASKMGFDLIGINNRDLSTFSVSLDVSVELSRLAPQSALLVSESGISKPTDIQILRAAGLRSCLIGEAFMRQENVAKAVHDLMSAAALAAPPTD